MSYQGKYLLNEFSSDKLDTEHVSGLSLFLYSRLLSILAKNSKGEIVGVHLYDFAKSEELFEIIERDPYIQSSNTFGKLFVHNAAFCLIPNPLFDPSHKEYYLNFTTEVIPGKTEVFYESIQGSEINVVGGLPLEILKKFEQPLPDLEVFPGAVFQLSYLLHPENIFEDQEVFIFPVPDNVYIAAFSLGTLAFFNSFPVHGDEDLLKYIFTVIQQLGFEQEHTKVNFLGDVSHVQTNNEVLSPYFKNISTAFNNQTNTSYAEKGISDFKKTKLLEAYWSI